MSYKVVLGCERKWASVCVPRDISLSEAVDAAIGKDDVTVLAFCPEMGREFVEQAWARYRRQFYIGTIEPMPS